MIMTLTDTTAAATTKQVMTARAMTSEQCVQVTLILLNPGIPF